ncbi:MAG: hypothetical protein AB2A00_35320 [Myxococcota bacterium]
MSFKIQDRGIRSAYNTAMQDGKISEQEMNAILDKAKDGNLLSAKERADLERILAGSDCNLEPAAKQAMVNYLNGLKACSSGDMEPPPAPRILNSMAFERAADGARFEGNSANPRTTVPNRDPVYIEMQNVELGTSFEIINLSKNPAASFDTKADVAKLDITGRDINNRVASIYLTAERMAELGIQPGDVYQIRAVDPKGNTSVPVTSEFEPNDWVNGRINEAGTFTPGTSFNALDGEAVRKNLLMKSVNDTREPQVLEEKLILVTDDRFDESDKELMQVVNQNWATLKQVAGKDSFKIEDFKTLSENANLPAPLREVLGEIAADPELFSSLESAYTGQKDGIFGAPDVGAVLNFNRSVTLTGLGAMEPRSTVTVQNQRTGQTYNATIGDDRQLRLNVGDLRDGDPLILTPRDNEGVTGKQVELVYSSRCKDGKAPKLTGGLGVRLPGVI